MDLAKTDNWRFDTMYKTLILVATASLLATSAFATQPRQPSGEAGKANLAQFQAFINAKQPAHVKMTRGCNPPVWTSACGRTPDNGYEGYNDHEGGGNGGGGKDSGK